MDSLTQCLLPIRYRPNADVTVKEDTGDLSDPPQPQVHRSQWFRRISLFVGYLVGRKVVDTPAAETLIDVEFLIDPPTVRQAMMLYGLFPNFDSPPYKARIQKILNEWVGDSGILEYFSDNEVSWKYQIGMFRMFIKSTEPDKEIKEQSESNLWGREESMSLLIAEYRYWYKADVMDEPWPMFLNQARKLTSLKAEAGLANLAWYVSGKSKEAFESLMERAGYEKGHGMDELPTVNEEQRKIQKDNASAIASMMARHQKAGRA